jgi:hypothetical protein
MHAAHETGADDAGAKVSCRHDGREYHLV